LSVYALSLLFRCNEPVRIMPRIDKDEDCLMFEPLPEQGIVEANGAVVHAREVSEIKNKVKELTVYCDGFKAPDNKKAAIQVLNTLIPFVSVYGVMLASYEGMYWLTLLLTPLAAGLLVRLFIIQHDCGHGSFFSSRVWNNRIGRLMSVMTWTPYDFWRKTHNIHHSTSGNLDGRGYGSIETVTVKEYAAMSAKEKFWYRVYRNPFVMLVFGTPYFILIGQRIPSAEPFAFVDVVKKVTSKHIWKSVMGLNLVLLVLFGGLSLIFGFAAVLLTYIPIVAMTALIGGWLFYIQHQFEDAHWDYAKDWDYHEAAVLGSSYYDLPKVFQWFTGNIGLHHIHHLNAKIPNYRLQECLDGHADLKTLNRITFWESLKYAKLALWDEDQRKMVTFAAIVT
jgi:acyl-lipid omega-6 desaturase (Delta-12 desaturase)